MDISFQLPWVTGRIGCCCGPLPMSAVDGEVLGELDRDEGIEIEDDDTEAGEVECFGTEDC